MFKLTLNVEMNVLINRRKQKHKNLKAENRNEQKVFYKNIEK